jgi:hypothetical protein
MREVGMEVVSEIEMEHLKNGETNLNGILLFQKIYHQKKWKK